MINISSNNPLDLFIKTFRKVYKLDDIKGDPRNYKDTPAVLSLTDYEPEKKVYLSEKGFVSSFNYDEYMVGGNDWMQVETEYYSKEYINSKKIDYLIKLFNYDPFTRRGVIDLWENYKLDLNRSFPCAVYACFRKIGDRLNMNYHMRANDAYNILLMDIHIATSLHVYVAKKLKLKLGNYNHFVDSLHLYKKHKGEIDKLYNKLVEM